MATLFTEDNTEEIGLKLYKQHNAITSGRYDFSACQLDILFMLLASLKKDQLTYTIFARDIELLTGREWNYKRLRESTADMGGRMFEIEESKSFTQVWLFQEVKYKLGSGSFDITISEKATHLFFELKNNFTHFQLKSVLGCSSSYAKRIYMLACQWRTVGHLPKPMLIKEFKEMIGLIDKKGNEKNKNIADFKRWVLDVAVKQINENTDIKIKYELFKKGRSYEFIQISLLENDVPKQLAIDFAEPIDTQKDIRTIMAYGIIEEHARLIVKDGMDNFLKFVKTVNERAKKGEINVENAPAYIIGSYQKKGIIPKKN